MAAVADPLPRLSRRALLCGELRARPAQPRPPWALAEADFLRACTACGDCLSACPEQVLVRDADGRAIFEPQQGECTFCGDCATACAAGAIDRARVASPWHWTAEVSDACLTRSGVVCSSCRDACGESAIRFHPVIGGVSQPQLDSARCTGCGACIRACPVSAIALVQPGAAP
ncbi:ferredoxin-type protein NapF [Luteimonas cucumeris]|uniref:ferredoxin-type protein NapF n=1 Tax=Luteimonas cucumeris TaxID=985012 RepID=UPI001F54CED3|nr:ferredoxin-type protein NapF [Luteimonas cucumeris]